MDPLSGTLYAKAGQTIPAGTYTVVARATDGSTATDRSKRSGVKNLALLVDGQTVEQSPDQACPASSCDYSHTFTITDRDLGEDGPKTISVIATDQLGHRSDPAAAQFTLRLDRVGPEINLSNDLADNDGATIAEATYDLSIEAVDASSSVTDVAISVDGTVVAHPTGCDFDAPCTWTFNAAAATAETHDIEVTATDTAGHTSTDGVTVNVRHIPELAPRRDFVLSDTQLRIDGATNTEQLGTAVATVGDVNGDGIDDFALGAPVASNNGRQYSGSVYLIYGGAIGTIDAANLGSHGIRIDGANALDFTGHAVAPAGDINGDGIPDLLIGSPGPFPPFGAASGLIPSVTVVFGARNLPPRIDLATLGSRGFKIAGPAATGAGSQQVGAFGLHLTGPRVGRFATAADVNGDGLDDIVIGSSTTPAPTGLLAPRANAGKTFVIFGKPDAAPVDVTQLAGGGFEIVGANADDQSGSSAAIVGDVNGDDLADIAVGAPGAQDRRDSGHAYVVWGKPDANTVDLRNLQTGISIEGAENERLGTAVDGAGDTNGDGVADIAIGSDTGIRLVYGFASDDGLNNLDTGDPSFSDRAATFTAGKVRAIASAGDLNADQLTDLVVGQPGSSMAGSQTAGTATTLLSQLGRTRLFANTSDPANMGAQEGVTVDGGSPRFGGAIDGYDSDGAGSPGIITGEPDADANGRSQSGSVYVIPAEKTAPVAYTARTCSSAPYAFSSFLDIPPCRRGIKDALDKARNAHGCGLARGGAHRSVQCISVKGGFGGRGKLRLRKPLRSSTSSSLDADLMNADMDGRRRYAWALLDSNRAPVGYVRPDTEAPKPQKYDLVFYDANKNLIGHTGASQSAVRDARFGIGDTRIESAPCMAGAPGAAKALAQQTAIIFFDFQGASAHDTAGPFADTGGRSLAIRAVINREAFPANAFRSAYQPGESHTNDEWLDHYYLPCNRSAYGSRPSGPLPAPVAYTAPDFTPWTATAASASGDAYQGYESASRGCQATFSAKDRDPRCGGSLRNYEFPSVRQPAGTPSFAPTVMIAGSTTGVRGARGGRTAGSGVSRAILRVGPDVRVLDHIDYVDPNVPCKVTPSAHWQFMRIAMGVYGWGPRKYGDALSPPLSPAPAPSQRCP